MPWQIRNPKKEDLFLHSTIDSSGMSVYWTEQSVADKFFEKAGAESMVNRCKERYLLDHYEIVECA